MFGASSNQKEEFLKERQKERQRRLESKLQNVAIVKIQALVRGFITSRRFSKKIRDEFDVFFGETETRQTALELFKHGKKLLVVYRPNIDDKRLQTLCKEILFNLEHCSEPKYWYMSVMLMKEWTLLWMNQLKQILNLCLINLKNVQSCKQSSSNGAHVDLNMISYFVDCSKWKMLKMKGGENVKPIMEKLCTNMFRELNSKGLMLALKEYLLNGLSKQSISLTEKNISVAMTLASRCIASLDSGILVFILNIMVVPAFLYHCGKVSPDVMRTYFDVTLFENILSTLNNYNNMSMLYSTLSADKCLCITGNLVDLCMRYVKSFSDFKDQFKIVVCGLLKHSLMSTDKRQRGNVKWHLLLGWIYDESKFYIDDATAPHVIHQIKYLTKQPLLGYFFENLPSIEESQTFSSSSTNDDSKGGRLRKAFMKAFKRSSTNELFDINEPIVMDICMSCDLYQTLTSALCAVRMEILADLCLQEEIFVRLWRFIYSLGPGSGMKTILNYVNGNTGGLPVPLTSLLLLFFECSCYLIPILDDFELYEKQRPFMIDDLVNLSAFLNAFVFKIIWHYSGANAKSVKERDDKNVMTGAMNLLSLLYRRDCRRSFTPKEHWLIKELRFSQFHGEFRDKKERALKLLQHIPHAIPHMERVKLFHQTVEDDKKSLGINKEFSRASALISVRRNRLLEDGYEQLHKFSGSQLKGIIRVKFVNDQGLDEAGIDQDGVFKEFLEEVIGKAFNPQLNLFKMTSGGETQQRLYPSPTSFIHDNHLELFEFVGKMLGKSLYEGILVDVPFASFFLNSMLRQQESRLYSSIDELPSLDPEMYKNLIFVKNYKGDVSDLQLYFAYDEDVLGQVGTYDLKPGGRYIQVNNANKFAYVHLMARFRLHTQLKDQVSAFMQGFNSVISPDWLNIFSGPELQRLISGDTGNLDLIDLKSNTVYYGGYHGNHQTISWLWDIIINEFSLKEKKLFLKFVTSCSNPPLLGFKYLEPPFSIRFVDSTEEEDTGDTVSSVMRGLFNVRRRSTASSARLPTASTCFNLLKLPCYKKRSILRDKLRYAIQSGAGFELS